MAQVTVWRTAFENGNFPPVCCKTGQRADLYSVWRFAGGRLRGVLPITRQAQRKVVAARRVAWILGVAAIAAWVGRAVAPDQGYVIAVPLTIAWIAAALGAWMWAPRASAEDTDKVHVSRVHPAFVASLTASS